MVGTMVAEVIPPADLAAGHTRAKFQLSKCRGASGVWRKLWPHAAGCID